MRERGKRKAEMDIRNKRRDRYKTIDKYTIRKRYCLVLDEMVREIISGEFWRDKRAYKYWMKGNEGR